MTSAEVRVPRSSPWLSVWLSPRQTIEGIVAANPRRHVLLLAGLGGIGAIISVLIGFGAATELMDLSNFAHLAVVGFAFGIVCRYINGLSYKWSRRMLGGRASSVEVRTAFAWGALPNIVGVAIFLVILVGANLAGMPKPASGALISALQGITAVLGLWSLV